MTWRENRKLVFIQHETSLRRGKWIELVMAGKSDERIPYLVTPHRHNQTYDDTVWTLGRLVPVIKDCRDWRYFRRWENINCSVEHSIILSFQGHWRYCSLAWLYQKRLSIQKLRLPTNRYNSPLLLTPPSPFLFYMFILLSAVGPEVGHS